MRPPVLDRPKTQGSPVLTIETNNQGEYFLRDVTNRVMCTVHRPESGSEWHMLLHSSGGVVIDEASFPPGWRFSEREFVAAYYAMMAKRG